jgi:hypothetical protein
MRRHFLRDVMAGGAGVLAVLAAIGVPASTSSVTARTTPARACSPLMLPVNGTSVGALSSGSRSIVVRVQPAVVRCTVNVRAVPQRAMPQIPVAPTH